MNIDWNLLSQQKQDLLDLRSQVFPDQQEALSGVIHLLDALEDQRPRHEGTVGWSVLIEHIDHGKFYICATAPDGTYTYDGYWLQEGATVEGALAEALRGSGLNRE